MRRSSESPGGSARKRRRLSSPTYEDHFGPISQQDVQAFDELEMRLSQSVPVVPSQSRGLPPEEVQGTRVDDIGEWLDGENDAERDVGNNQEWSSSPLANPGTQERAADDHFFSTGSGAGGGFVSAASFDTTAERPPPPHAGRSGFASAAALPTPSQSFGGFASAAKLPAVPGSHQQDEQESNAPFVAPEFTGFGRASALPALPMDERSPSPPAPQEYDSWFDSDASTLPPDAFAFRTARTIMSASQPAVEAASQTAQFGGFTSGLAHFRPASQANQDQEPPSQRSEGTDAPVGFTSAATAGLPAAAGGDAGSAAQVGFTSAAQLNGGKSSWAAPSAEALARAAEKMKQWEVEIDHAMQSAAPQDAENDPPPNSEAPASHPPPLQTPLRPALRPVENAHSPAHPPDTPTPAGAAPKEPTHFTVVAGMQIKNKPFKSPLMIRPQAAQARSVSAPSLYVGSPLNPGRPSGFRVASSARLPAAFTNDSAVGGPMAGPATPAEAAPGTSAFVSPVKAGPTGFVSPAKASASSFASPVKALGMTPRRLGTSSNVGKGKFSTPFKPGLAPGEPGRTQLEQDVKEEQARAASANPLQVYAGSTASRKGKERKVYEFFDLNPPPERRTLASSGLRPLSYSEEDLEDMGINVEELRQMRPSNAMYYRFYSADPAADIGDPADSEQLGPKAAFVHLKERGCHLATLEWVMNHYGLILWKLAGMVCLEPERERDPETKRWCRREVIRQLLYRYERELNGGSRPALRLISTEDTPASCPMVLCVSNIVFHGSSATDRHGIPLDPHPELEVTDGWYRLRAKVDMPLARAIRKGRICIGTKLAISGAKLSGDRKEPCEILEAYDNTCLELSGNSTNLAPWHTKLGFVKQPFIATLDKLTADGGVVPAMDVVITKTYPIAFVEFVRDEYGSVERLGPRDEKEEMKAHDQWLAKQEAESAKIREKLQANVDHLMKLSERLYSRAGPRFDFVVSQGETMPDHIEGIFEEMMDEYSRPSQAFDRLDSITAGWLHLYCEQQAEMARTRMSDEIARELQEACPPRNVRDFRVVVAKDARWRKKEPMRSVQITLWDPLKVIFSENGNPGEIKVGQRFLVTNLTPNQASAWMAPGPGALVYLVSKRTSSWTNIKSGKR